MKTETLKGLSERLAKAADLPEGERKDAVAKIMDEMSIVARVEKATTVYEDIAKRAGDLAKSLKDGEALTDEQATEMATIETLAKSAYEAAVAKAEGEAANADDANAGDGTGDAGDDTGEGAGEGEGTGAGEGERTPTEKAAKPFPWPRDMAKPPAEKK